jgi:hypothetical protein
MRRIASCLAALLLLLLAPAAAPGQAGGSCYQPSNLVFFQEVVEVVAAERRAALGCWVVRLRLRTSPQAHAMFCDRRSCAANLGITEGIYWWGSSPVNENIERVLRVENGSCTDVSFCIVPEDEGETSLIDLAAIYQEADPPAAGQPRWNHGVIDLSSLDGLKSHCQDGEPRGAVCL